MLQEVLAKANCHFAQEATLNNILEISLSETYTPKQTFKEFAAVRTLCEGMRDRKKRGEFIHTGREKILPFIYYKL